MKDRPILFSGPMVRAILEGRKTQTRRIVKPQSFIIVQQNGQALTKYGWLPELDNPYGQRGGKLWVRETFRLSESNDCACYEPCSCKIGSLIYRATANMEREEKTDPPWKPSIFMPRWASRITLEIVSVRAERLQDISNDDVEAEGVKTSKGVGLIDGERCFEFPTGTGYSRIGWHAYKALWESINGPGSWALNPWVWVIEFKHL